VSSKNLDSDVEVYKHGKTYSETDELENSYPFQLCPECMSQNTSIIKRDDNCVYQTGEYTYERKRFMDRKIIVVNHQCNSCGCKFQHRFVDKSKRESMEVNEDICRCIIFTLIFALSLTAGICGWTAFGVLDEDNAPWWLYLWVAVSTLASVVSGILTAAGFEVCCS
jgi:hypothetical protein